MFGTAYFITQRDKHTYFGDILNVIVFSVLRGKVTTLCFVTTV